MAAPPPPDPESMMQTDPHEEFFLQHLVTLANRHQITFPVTLQIGGFLVMGNLIGGAEYFDTIATSIEDALPDRSRHWVEFAKSFASFGDPYKEPPEDADPAGPPPRYLHLKNARIVAAAGGESLLASPRALWRGRISAVDGFVLGIQPPPPRPEGAAG